MAESTRRSLQELSAEVAANPNSTAFVELAAAYRERGDLDRALRLCLRGLQRHPTHVEAHCELGRIYEQRGERELALDEWGIVLQLAPDHLPSRLSVIRLYLDEGRRADAEQELLVARKIAPGDATVAELSSRLQATRRDGDEAETTTTAVSGLFTTLEREAPGTLGALLVDATGQLVEGRMTPRGVESDRMLGVTLSGARAEAERVASYLQLGGLQSLLIESAVVRLTISEVGRNTLIVATACDLPAGQAARVLERARELAREHLDSLGK
ncbi:MAG: tetratricopeptide repeat protein [Gemmatimonadota bacterium]|nr:MAG: tetratricopeptide repeat protein [Gemmatimonadota bacterium]